MYHFDTCNSILFKHRIHDPHPKNIQLKSAKMSAATSSFEAAAVVCISCSDNVAMNFAWKRCTSSQSPPDRHTTKPYCCLSLAVLAGG
jgi:hypothetical protein